MLDKTESGGSLFTLSEFDIGVKTNLLWKLIAPFKSVFTKITGQLLELEEVLNRGQKDL